MKASLLLLALTLPPLAGFLVARYLNPTLERLLTELCGSVERAGIWVRLVQLFLMLGPTALALMRADGWRSLADGLDTLHTMASITVNGLLIVLTVVAWVLWRQIPKDREERS